MSIFWDYKPKALKNEIPCAACIHAKIRWWSGRIGCGLYNGYAVSKKGTCSKAEKKPKEATNADED